MSSRLQVQRPGRLTSAAPVVAALLAASVVVVVVLLSRSGEQSEPIPPGPVYPTPLSLDMGEQSLDRCAMAIAAAGLVDRYPDRAEWRRLAILFTGDTFVTLLDGAVPFVCVTRPRTVEVSDPGAAVPIGTARLLLTTPGGVLAAAAAGGETVRVGAAAGGPGSRYFLGLTGTPVTRPDQLLVTVEEATPRSPERLAPPAVHLADRPWEPDSPPTRTSDLLQRCQAAQAAAEPQRPWQTAHVLAYRRGGQAAFLVVAISTGIVGGCTAESDEAADVTPLRLWHVGRVSDGPRPFTWLPRPGAVLPDLGGDIAVGPVQPSVAWLEITAASGLRWEASVAGGTFATQIPAGVPPDADGLIVRAFDAQGGLIYEGPATG